MSKGLTILILVKQCIILSICIFVILTWCRMMKVLKDVKDVVDSRLCHSSNTQIVGRELGLAFK